MIREKGSLFGYFLFLLGWAYIFVLGLNYLVLFVGALAPIWGWHRLDPGHSVGLGLSGCLLLLSIVFYRRHAFRQTLFDHSLGKTFEWYSVLFIVAITAISVIINILFLPRYF